MTSRPRPHPDGARRLWPWVPAVGLTLSLGLGVAGCTGTEDAVPAPSPPDPEQNLAPDIPSDTSTDGAPDGTPGGPSTAAPRPRRTEPPPWVTRPSITRSPAPGATGDTAGAGRRAFPRPADLGPAWTYRSGFAEEPYADPDAPAVLRDPGEAVRGAVPRGCRPPADARPADLEPVRASLVTYEAAGDWVDALRVQFASPADAARFAASRRSALRTCVGRGSVTAVGPLVTRVVDLDADTLLSDRTPESDAYSEVSVLDRDTVVLVTRRTDDPPTLRAARALAAAFTGARVPGGIS